MHGANRLASNYLLEGLVFGHRITQKVKETLPGVPEVPKTLKLSYQLPQKGGKGFPAESIRKALQRLMWDKVGIIRIQTVSQLPRSRTTNELKNIE